MIKTERLELIIEILTSQMNHWIFFPLVMTLSGLAIELSRFPEKKDPGFLFWAVCGLIPIAFFLVRYYVQRFWLFVLCHGAVIACTICFASLSGYMICVICAAAYTFHSFMLRLKENASVYTETIHPVTASVIFVAANYLFHKQKNIPDWDKYFMFILIGVLACYLIIYYLRHYLSFLLVNKSSAGYLPAKEILHSGIGFVLPYTLIGVLILALSLNLQWLEPILRILKEILKVLLRMIIRLLPDGGAAEEPLPIENQGHTAAPGDLNLPPAETFWLWEVLEYAAIILFVCGCVYVLAKALKRLVRFLQTQFGRKAEKISLITDEESVFDIREKCNIVKKENNTKKAGLFRRFTPEERIRKLYKKRVLSGKSAEDRAALNYMTAKECGASLSLPGMAELYEHARYSDREITADDVKQMKHACSLRSTP